MHAGEKKNDNVRIEHLSKNILFFSKVWYDCFNKNHLKILSMIDFSCTYLEF